MGKKIKNKDIAARLGLSGTLVSLVLNNKADQHGIKKETQERVLAMARQMGYFNAVSDRGESVPAEEKPGVIGMIVPSMNDPFIYEITPYLQKAFASIGFGFSVITRDSDDQRFNRLTSSLRKFFTGMILVGNAADDNVVRTLNRESYPLVLLEKSIKRMRLNTVCTDRMAGSDIMTEHLASLKLKNILVISGEDTAQYDKELLEELKQSAKKRKEIDSVYFNMVRVPRADETFDFSQIDTYMRPPYRCDAIVVLNSALVSPIYIAMQERNIRIPHDVALVSMDDGMGFDLFCTPVTRLRKPLAAMSLKVANILWSEVKNQGKSKYKRQVNMSPELVVRSSCGSYIKKN